MSKEKQQQIQKEYNAITSFGNNELKKLAEKHGITLDELLDVVNF